MKKYKVTVTGEATVMAESSQEALMASEYEMSIDYLEVESVWDVEEEE